MKIWIKLLAGAVIGLLLGLFLPQGNASLGDVFSFLSKFSINIGRYAVFPMIFFSLAIGTYELKREKKVLRVYGRSILYLLAFSALLAIFGTLSALVLSPDRIPIIIEEEAVFSIPGIKDVLLQIFPRNFFQVFNDGGNFLLPLYFLSFFLGLNFTFDRLVTRPVVQFFDSISRIFYHINSFVLEIMGLGMIAICTFLVMRISSAPEIGLYSDLLIVLCVDSAIVVFGIYPTLLYFLAGKSNPFKWLYASLAPAIVGFVSGDAYFSLNALTRNGKENIGIPRKIGSATFPLFALFGKAGTAMVSSVSFIVILRSYSSLGITVPQTLWVIVFSFLVSLSLGSVPGLGAFVAVSMLSNLFGNSYEVGYLILRPVAPLIISFAVLLDVITASLVSMLVSRHEGMQEDIPVREYI